MNNNEKYFVALISSHLNNMAPPACSNIGWEEIYGLSNIHNVCAMVFSQIQRLAPCEQPEKEMLSKFRQQTGYTLIDFEGKERVLNFLREFFTNEGIDFLFVKGAVLRSYYPVKELRTSGDTDVIIKYGDSDKCRLALKKNNIPITDDCKNGIAVDFQGQHIEIHTNLDCDHPYFKNIFDMCEKNGYEYSISDEVHLLYVMCHIIKHFNLYGAGIKMFTDIDVLIRHMQCFDYDGFMEKCRLINIETFAKASLSLCSYWFNTPVTAEIDFAENTEFRELFENEIINSGSYGLNKRDLGDYYINKGMGKSAKNNFSAKVRAFFTLLFPGKKYMMNYYRFVEKHPFLLPAAYIHRLFAAMFRRTGHSVKTIKSIINTGNDSEQYKKLLNELDI